MGDSEITLADRKLTTSPPRARGQAFVSTRCRDGVSVLKDLRQSGSMRVLFPRPSSPPTAMLLNTAGGVTGGDRFDVSVEVQPQATLTVTTQAAERAYRATPGQTGILSNKISVQDGGHVNWLPQETILFDGCDLSRKLSVDVTGSGTALIVEPLIFGRPAHGETLQNARFREHVRIRHAGRLVYADGIELTGDIHAHMQARSRGDGAGAMVTLIYMTPHAETMLPRVRGHFAEKSGICAGASLLSENLLLMRALAHDSYEMRQLLLPVLEDLTGDALPVCWRL